MVKELKELNKPFVIVLNTNNPYSDYTKELSRALEDKYQVAVIPTDCTNLNMEDVNDIFGKYYMNFQLKE